MSISFTNYHLNHFFVKFANLRGEEVTVNVSYSRSCCSHCRIILNGTFDLQPSVVRRVERLGCASVCLLVSRHVVDTLPEIILLVSIKIHLFQNTSYYPNNKYHIVNNCSLIAFSKKNIKLYLCIVLSQPQVSVLELQVTQSTQATLLSSFLM